MLDRREIRQNPDAVRAAVRVKGIDLDVDELLQLDKASRELDRKSTRLNSSHARSA
jgi:seryl-tRNA synthetase